MPVQLEPFTDQYLPLLKRWLTCEHVKPWFPEPEEWLREIGARHGEFQWIRHFIIFADETPIGFCQDYPYWKSGEGWHGRTPVAGTYSIDYLIGNPNYLRKGYGRGAVACLVENIAACPDARRIIVQPDENNLPSRNTLLSAGFRYDSENRLYLREL